MLLQEEIERKNSKRTRKKTSQKEDSKSQSGDAACDHSIRQAGRAPESEASLD